MSVLYLLLLSFHSIFLFYSGLLASAAPGSSSSGFRSLNNSALTVFNSRISSALASLPLIACVVGLLIIWGTLIWFDLIWFDLIWVFRCRMFPFCLLIIIFFLSFAVAVSSWASITSSPLVLLPFPLIRFHLMRNSTSTTTCASLCLSMRIYNFR